jgi:hypothetical protein
MADKYNKFDHKATFNEFASTALIGINLLIVSQKSRHLDQIDQCQNVRSKDSIKNAKIYHRRIKNS